MVGARRYDETRRAVADRKRSSHDHSVVRECAYQLRRVDWVRIGVHEIARIVPIGGNYLLVGCVSGVAICIGGRVPALGKDVDEAAYIRNRQGSSDGERDTARGADNSWLGVASIPVVEARIEALFPRPLVPVDHDCRRFRRRAAGTTGASADGGDRVIRGAGVPGYRYLGVNSPRRDRWKSRRLRQQTARNYIAHTAQGDAPELHRRFGVGWNGDREESYPPGRIT